VRRGFAADGDVGAPGVAYRHDWSGSCSRVVSARNARSTPGRGRSPLRHCGQCRYGFRRSHARPWRQL